MLLTASDCSSSASACRPAASNWPRSTGNELRPPNPIMFAIRTATKRCSGLTLVHRPGRGFDGLRRRGLERPRHDEGGEDGQAHDGKWVTDDPCDRDERDEDDEA